jgi:hypothetical protein
MTEMGGGSGEVRECCGLSVMSESGEQDRVEEGFAMDVDFCRDRMRWK